MNRRAIVATPPLPVKPLTMLRDRYDPLAALIPPHLTLVFPFDSALSARELHRHVATAVAGVAPFPVRLAGITGSEGEYLFLNVKRGNDALIDLHDRLYSGPLRAYRSLAHTFVPHLTVGRLSDPVAFERALAFAATLDIAVETVVATLTVYQVATNGRRSVEMSVTLQEPPGAIGTS